MVEFVTDWGKIFPFPQLSPVFHCVFNNLWKTEILGFSCFFRKIGDNFPQSEDFCAETAVEILTACAGRTESFPETVENAVEKLGKCHGNAAKPFAKFPKFRRKSEVESVERG